jgi:hypothetical protein
VTPDDPAQPMPPMPPAPRNPLLPYPLAYVCSVVVCALLAVLGFVGLTLPGGGLVALASVLGLIGTALLPHLALTPRRRAQQFMLAATGRLPRDLGRPPA